MNTDEFMIWLSNQTQQSLCADITNILATAPDPQQFKGCEPLPDGVSDDDSMDPCGCQGCGKVYAGTHVMIVEDLGPVCMNCNYWMAYILLVVRK